MFNAARFKFKRSMAKGRSILAGHSDSPMLLSTTDPNRFVEEQGSMKYKSIILAAALPALLAAPGNTIAQSSPFIYPQDNQTPEQQRADESSCRQWATQQTNFDPQQAELEMLRNQQARSQQGAADQAATASQSDPSVLGTTARTTAAGALIGAAAGDAGTGAKVGAATGALRGIGKRNRSKKEKATSQEATQQYVQQGNAADAQRFTEGQASYDRAFATCMQARNYSVG